MTRIVVIGGGIAGLTAALRASELGHAVTLLEQGLEELYPCNSRLSGGLLHIAFHDVQRPEAELQMAIDNATRHTCEPVLSQAVATEGRRLLAWLRGHGVRFMRFSTQEAHRWGMAPPRPIAPGISWEGRGPDVMLRTLGEALVKSGGRIELGARGRSLVMERARCVGVRGESRGSDQVWPADAVVIADGGFQANHDLFRTHIGPSPEKILQRGAGNGRGDGMLMAVAVGTATAGMAKFYGHVQTREALQDPRLWPYPELDSVAASALVVDGAGKRFVDEGLGGISIANAIARFDDPASATLVFNPTIWEGPGRLGRLPANPFLERFGGAIVRASSVPELARRLGLPPTSLQDTLDVYNNALTQNTLADLTPPRSGDGSKKAWPVTAPPYLAIPLCVGITYTTGGLVIDGDARVLRRDGSVIAGLYAAGTVTAGLDGTGDSPHVGYVGGLVKAVFGLRAAEHLHSFAQERATPATALFPTMTQP